MASKAESEIRAQLTSLIFLVKEFHYLTESRITDFFVEDHYSKLPSTWKTLFETLTLEAFGEFLDLQNSIPAKNVWPLSLLCLRKMVQTNCIPRQQQSSPFKANGFSIDQETPVKTVYLNRERMQYRFSKNVKPKKRYEIQQMSLETARLAAKTGVNFVIDIGSGLGHLCRVLGYGYGLNAIGVETRVDLNKRAASLDLHLEKAARKIFKCGGVEKFRPCHLLRTISLDTSSQDFNQMVQESGGNLDDFGIVGLHPCGNLAPNLLKIFSKCPEAKFLILASCCYHKMFSPPEVPRFPMSSFLSSDKSLILKVESANWASHAIEVTSKRLSTGDYNFLKIHCFRATLEQIISQEWPQHLQKSLKNVPHYPDLTFEDYCQKSLKKLGVQVPEKIIKSDQVQKNLSRWKDVVLYHSLCSLLAPVSETIFLLDRMLYLTEQGIPCQLQAVFDPMVSPRNCILTAMKSESKR